MTHVITLIPGDGIGPEVTEAVVRILQGRGRSTSSGSGTTPASSPSSGSTRRCPPSCSTRSSRNKVALKGPVTTPIGEGFTSVNVGLRKALDLYANLRPVQQPAGRREPLSATST